jgi:SAM-dependent methyltransferase
MIKKDNIRYKAIAKLISELKIKFLGDFGSGNQVLKKFLGKSLKYKSFDYPKYDLEKPFSFKEDLDGVISQEVIEHLRNPRIFLNSLNKSLKNKTKLIITVPNSAFIKYRIQLLFGKTPDTFMGPTANISLFGKEYNLLSKEKKLELDFMLHVRSYNYEELKKILELEGFKIIKRMKLKYAGLNGFFLSLLPLNFQGCHFILAELRK